MFLREFRRKLRKKFNILENYFYYYYYFKSLLLNSFPFMGQNYKQNIYFNVENKMQRTKMGIKKIYNDNSK